jgi:TusA-related sulfurtransferase
MPIVHLKLELENLNSNQVAEVLADDPGFGNDIIAWCKETNNELLFLTKNEEDIFVAYVEKA